VEVVFEADETPLETQVAGKIKIVSGKSTGTVAVLRQNLG